MQPEDSRMTAERSSVLVVHAQRQSLLSQLSSRGEICLQGWWIPTYFRVFWHWSGTLCYHQMVIHSRLWKYMNKRQILWLSSLFSKASRHFFFDYQCLLASKLRVHLIFTFKDASQSVSRSCTTDICWIHAPHSFELHQKILKTNTDEIWVEISPAPALLLMLFFLPMPWAPKKRGKGWM